MLRYINEGDNMSEEQNTKQEENAAQVPSLVEATTGQAELDVSKLDLNNLPEDIKNLKFRMPVHGVEKPLWKILLSGIYNFPKPKVSKSWFNGELITTEEYNKLPPEETLAYRNQIRKAKK